MCLIEGNEDEVEAGIDAAADFVDDKTGGEYSEKIDTAADQAKRLLGDE